MSSKTLNGERQFAFMELRVAMIGFGGIGAAHKAAYDYLSSVGAPVRLVAICDKNKDCISNTKTTNLGTVDVGDLNSVNIYDDCDDLINKENFDIADICLPTFLHKDFATKLLRAGKHVLCEKPMALCGEDCDEMVRVARECGKELMVGQCLRFDFSYLYLKRMIESMRFGEVQRISMGRLSFMPKWGGWFNDDTKSGGVITDFHIHDIDMVRFLFGEPYAVSSIAYPREQGNRYVSSRFYYDNLIAEAQASFDESPTAPFDMWYRVRFENANVVFENGEITVFPDDGEPYSPKLNRTDRIAEEIAYFITVILDVKDNTVNPADSAAKSIKLAELVAESARRGGEILRGDGI